MSEGWRQVCVGDVAKVLRGASPRPKGDPRYYGGTVPRLMVADVTRDGRYVTPKIDFLTEEGANLSRPMPAGTLTIVCSGDVGTPSFLAVDACIHDGFLAVDEISEDCFPEYLYEVFCSLKSRLERSATHGGVFTNLTTEILREFPFLLPSFPEQRKIAEILRTWDEAVDKLEALRAVKLRRHSALTHSLVFGIRQLDRFRTTDEAIAYRWFTLPATWSSQPIGRLAREISERNGDTEQHEVLSCSKYDGFVRSLEYFKKQVFSADLSGYKKIWRGDFGFPSNHVEEGSIGLQNLTDVGVVSPIYTVFRFSPEKVDADYAFAVLKTGLYRHLFEVSTSASVDRRGSLRWGGFSKLPFPVPSLAEQKAIAEVLRTARADLDALDTEIETITRQKRGLMQKLLTGEWRVKVGAH